MHKFKCPGEGGSSSPSVKEKKNLIFRKNSTINLCVIIVG